MKEVASHYPFCLLIYMNSYSLLIYFILFYFIHFLAKNIYRFLIFTYFKVIIGLYTWV